MMAVPSLPRFGLIHGSAPDLFQIIDMNDERPIRDDDGNIYESDRKTALDEVLRLNLERGGPDRW